MSPARLPAPRYEGSRDGDEGLAPQPHHIRNIRLRIKHRLNLAGARRQKPRHSRSMAGNERIPVRDDPDRNSSGVVVPTIGAIGVEDGDEIAKTEVVESVLFHHLLIEEV